MSPEGYVTINTAAFWDIQNNSNFPTFRSNVAEILQNYDFIGLADGALCPWKKSITFYQFTRCHMSYDSSIHSKRHENIELRIVMSFS